jgi:hypothetical protein
MSAALTYSPLPSRALIGVSGPDWRDFLQNLLTQDVEGLAGGEARFAALLTPQGRLLYDLFVVGRAEGCWLDVLAQSRAALIQRLMIYRLRAKVEIAEDETPVSVLYDPAGSREGGNPGGASTAAGSAWVPAFAGMSGWVKDPRLAELGWRGYGASAPPGAEIADEAGRERFKLALGVPGPADWGSDRTYPIEADFDLLHGIDFQKGCFVGQETTSRMKRRSAVKTRMVPLRFEGPAPAPGTPVETREGLRAGEVLTGRDSRAMAVLRLDRAVSGPLVCENRPVLLDIPSWWPEGTVGSAG